MKAKYLGGWDALALEEASDDTKDRRFSFSMMEYPFYREGMTIEEWKAERQYMADHMADVKSGRYSPLWKQAEKEREI